MTRVWVHLIAQAFGEAPAGERFETFLGRNPQLLDRGLPGLYYSRELLQSAAVRASWAPPDLRPLPDLSEDRDRCGTMRR